jgi:hypothetical protein
LTTSGLPWCKLKTLDSRKKGAKEQKEELAATLGDTLS